jgi:membrane fusion protein, multidrug efflux system
LRRSTTGFSVPVLAAGLLLAGCGAEARSSDAGPPAERSVAVAAVQLAPLDLSQQIQVSGTIEPIREIRLAARMGGVVEQVRVEEGSRVAAGALLARFDVAEQRAELARARAQLEQARAAYERARQLVARELASGAEYEDARAARNVAQSEVQLWQTRAAAGLVTSPAGGVVTRKFVEAGSAVSNGEPLFVIADVSTLVVQVGIADVHATRLQVGQEVLASVEAFPGRQWPAQVRRVFPAADPDTRLVPVELAFTGAAAASLRPGVLARIRIDVDRRPDVLAVPNEALLASSRDDPFVYVIEDERLVRRSVATGVSRRDWTEITHGLQPGETVVASNPANLREGARVRVTGTVASPFASGFAEGS